MPASPTAATAAMTSRTAVAWPCTLTGYCVGDAARADDVAVPVAVVEGVRPRRLGDHDLLAVGRRDLAQHRRQVRGRAMPVRVVRAREHVVVDAEGGEARGVRRVAAGCLGVREVHGDECVGQHLAHRGAARRDERGELRVDAGPGGCSPAIALFVSLPTCTMLTSTPASSNDCSASAVKSCRAVDGLGVRESRPRLRRELARRVGPEVGVVEVDEHAEAGRGCALADLDGAGDIDVAAAVAAARRVERVVPDAHAHGVHAVVGEHVEQVGRRAGGVAEDDAALLERRARSRRRRRSRSRARAPRPSRRRCPRRPARHPVRLRRPPRRPRGVRSGLRARPRVR